MTLSEVAIRRPVFTTMISLLVVVLGVIGLNRLGTDLFPDVSFPFVAVTTVYRGAGPQEVEQQVVKPIEDAAAGIAGVETIQSFSRENVGVVFVQFKLSTALDRAVQEVRDKVATVQPLLPREADVPTVTRIDFGAAPILTYAVSASLPSTELRQLVKDKLEPSLAQIEGVASVRILGGDKREIRVDVDLDKAKSAGIAPAQIAERISSENVDVPVGQFHLGERDLGVRSQGQLRTVTELSALPVARGGNGALVRLDEVAQVSDGVADRKNTARLNGKEAVVVEVVKQPGSNTVLVAQTIKAKMIEMQPTLGHDFKAEPIIDTSTVIEENTHEVWVALIFGGLMAVLIILMFLLDPRGTFISSLALPTSVVGTFFVMYVLGYTLNQMTLLALSLAIGLLIDDAVVVREAITHRLDLGEAPESAAANGTKDVYLAVLATTLSLVAVFIPVAFMPGIVGQFFKQFGITISVAVLISLFISFTLDPMLSARMSKARIPGQKIQENAVAAFLRRGFEALERAYERVLAWTLTHRWLTGAITILTVVALSLPARNLGNDFMAPQDRSQILVELTLPTDASLTEVAQRAQIAEGILRADADIREVYTVVGGSADGMSGASNKARMRVLTKERNERSRPLEQIQSELREQLLKIPNTQVALLDPPDIEGLGDFFPIMTYIMGPDPKVLATEAERVSKILGEMQGVSDIRILANPAKPELGVRLDRTRANELGLSSGLFGLQLRLAMNGQVAGKLREGLNETDIVVRLQESDRSTPERLRQMDVFTPSGLRTLSDVADVGLQQSESVIEHFNRERRITVVASMRGGASLGDVAPKLKEALKRAPPPPGYSVFYDGQMKTLDEQNEAFGFAMVLAFVFIYMVLASQFESFKHPFTIMLSLPLALVGGTLGLAVSGFSMTLGASIGFILLIGLVTKNAILLVDQILQNLRAGDALDTAIIKAGPRRLRPILMTSAAMAIGMVPTAVGRGQGFEFRAPMAVAVIGGVLTSTLLTLFVVPLVFAVVEKLTPKRFRIGAKSPHSGEALHAVESHS
jgi:hydrophobic/amphiphilic exporter-1 (mainly G- bacteria), HAE1 family